MKLTDHQNVRFLLVQVISPHIHRDEALKNLFELESLVSTFEGLVVSRILQHRQHPDMSTYVGSGKVEEIKKLVDRESINIVVLNAIVNSGQIFRLEKALWQNNPDIVVWDRVDLILAIFDKHAVTTEAKLQVELAKLEHMGPRIYGLGGTYFSRQAGGIGVRGLGETNVELMKRQIKDRARKLRKKLFQLEQNRKNLIRRRRGNGIVTVSLVGYTNSGKTTLFNRLTGRDKPAANVLFTTLDAVVGKVVNVRLDKTILLSDTIGFIKDLPPFLINTFKSTLLEAVYADCVLHVVDVSDPQFREKIAVVERILYDLSVDCKKIKLIFNKIDALTENEREIIEKKYVTEAPFFVSAKTGEGIEKLANIESINS